jgi:hypothetical protein
MDTQIAQQQMPATRLRVALRHYLAAIDEDESYAEAIVHQANRERRIGPAGTTLDDLDDDGVKGVIFKVKDQCRRRWPKVADLREDVWDWMGAHVAAPQAATKIICDALNVRECPQIGKLYYEPLLIAFGALKLAHSATVNQAVYEEFPAL